MRKVSTNICRRSKNPARRERTHVRLGLMLCALAIAWPCASAQKSLTGEATFYAQSNHSLDDCREAALQLARNNALSAEYGFIVSDETYSHESTSGGNEQSYFEALSATELRGEWIADDGEPKYEVSLSPEGLYVVKCSVRGKTRPLSNEAPEFKSAVLRNGDSLKFSSTQFKSGDNMFVYLRTPVDGFAAVYLACPDGQVYSLLPYQNDDDGKAPVKGNKEYIIFSTAHTELGDVDPMETSVADGESMERNQLYVIFSPNEFTKALDGGSGAYVPRSLSFGDFKKWLFSRRTRDPKMSYHIHHLTIEK